MCRLKILAQVFLEMQEVIEELFFFQSLQSV